MRYVGVYMYRLEFDMVSSLVNGLSLAKVLWVLLAN